MNRKNCPCCGFPTLERHSIFEICELCDWEDDGQDDNDADEVRGGPNGDYSLTEARENFKLNLIMYRDIDNITPQIEQQLKLKKLLMNTFNRLDMTTSDTSESKLIWDEIVSYEQVLLETIK